MTPPMSPPPTRSPEAPPPSRGLSRWGVFLPVALLVALAAGWSVFWFVAAGKAAEAADAWIAREAKRGRTYACAERETSGFPFRIELSCNGATASLPADGGPIVATAPRFVAVAQIYDPRRLIGDVRGPIEVTDASGRKATLSFATAQASVAVSSDRRFDRTSIALTAPRLVAGADEIGAAKHLELHLRRAPDGSDGVYDLAVRVEEATSPALALVPVGAGPVSGELQIEARGVGDLAPQPTSDRLRAFAEAGGRLHVALARVTRGDVAAEAKGDLALNVEGRPEGKLTLTARGVDQLVQTLFGAGEESDGRKDLLSSLLGAGAKMLGSPATLDDRPATAYPVRIANGRLSIGPVKLWRSPPLF